MYDLIIYPYSFFKKALFATKVVILFEINKHLGVSRDAE